MRAITVVPGRGEPQLGEVPDPVPRDGELLVETLALGVCGTDREIVSGKYGWAPEGRERLVLGHEALGRVLESPAGSGFTAGDLLVPIVRRPDPVPCACCAAGQADMCRNGRYQERGIKELDGYGSERFTVEPQFAVKLETTLARAGVLVEPASVLAKAWEHIDRIAARACVPLDRALITGAGPIGLLAALMGVQRGIEVHVLDKAEDGLKPELVRALGAEYVTGGVERISPEVVIECTGVAELVVETMLHTAPGAVVCLTGVAPSRSLTLDVGALNNELVLENDVVFGSVNANRSHFRAAVDSLVRADGDWLERLITRRVTLTDWDQALERQPDDVKNVIEFASAA
ncbi:MAG TPA: glucose 1-dehydrogenase [Polyangiaceae bacterium]|nr:glucose 1-dehydrogenase [Polyangiaceae bacterium]